MAPVDPQLTLGPVLDLIERWQRDREDPDVLRKLSAVDTRSIVALAAQHAAQLREIASRQYSSELRSSALDAAKFLAAKD
jgi:hypothetical protein